MNLLQARTEIPEHLDVTLAVIVKDDKLLLARKLQKIGAGLWNGPGGKIEAGETPSQAMVRECEEELCIRPTKFVVAGEIYFFFQMISNGICTALFTGLRHGTVVQPRPPKWLLQPGSTEQSYHSRKCGQTTKSGYPE